MNNVIDMRTRQPVVYPAVVTAWEPQRGRPADYQGNLVIVEWTGPASSGIRYLNRERVKRTIVGTRALKPWNGPMEIFEALTEGDYSPCA